MSGDYGAAIASVQVGAEKEATGKVKDIFEEIQETLGIDFVPNMYNLSLDNSDKV